MRINLPRVLIGGILGGLIINIGEWFLNFVIVVDFSREFFAKHNVPLPEAGALIPGIGMNFLLGVVIALGYASIRPRFGGGPRSALIFALFAWFLVYVYPGVFNMILFSIPLKQTLIAFGWSLFEYVLAALVSAAIYKEN
jgi:hypothetical protein